MNDARPSIDAWLAEIKRSPEASGVGIYLAHNGVVRGRARDGSPVSGMELSCDAARLGEAIDSVRRMDGVIHVRAWVNEGTLAVGDDIMMALVAGDIRKNVFGALQELVRLIKSGVVTEREIAP